MYKSSHSGLSLRVYFMLYQSSCEEHKYLAGLRKEKDSFESLIKERGVRKTCSWTNSLLNIDG